MVVKRFSSTGRPKKWRPAKDAILKRLLFAFFFLNLFSAIFAKFCDFCQSLSGSCCRDLYSFLSELLVLCEVRFILHDNLFVNSH